MQYIDRGKEEDILWVESEWVIQLNKYKTDKILAWEEISMRAFKELTDLEVYQVVTSQ